MEGNYFRNSESLYFKNLTEKSWMENVGISYDENINVNDLNFFEFSEEEMKEKKNKFLEFIEKLQNSEIGKKIAIVLPYLNDFASIHIIVGIIFNTVQFPFEVAGAYTIGMDVFAEAKRMMIENPGYFASLVGLSVGMYLTEGVLGLVTYKISDIVFKGIVNLLFAGVKMIPRLMKTAIKPTSSFLKINKFSEMIAKKVPKTVNLNQSKIINSLEKIEESSLNIEERFNQNFSNYVKSISSKGRQVPENVNKAKFAFLQRMRGSVISFANEIEKGFSESFEKMSPEKLLLENNKFNAKVWGKYKPIEKDAIRSIRKIKGGIRKLDNWSNKKLEGGTAKFLFYLNREKDFKMKVNYFIRGFNSATNKSQFLKDVFQKAGINEINKYEDVIRGALSNSSKNLQNVFEWNEIFESAGKSNITKLINKKMKKEF